jgi:hypothetical protein
MVKVFEIAYKDTGSAGPSVPEISVKGSGMFKSPVILRKSRKIGFYLSFSEISPAAKKNKILTHERDKTAQVVLGKSQKIT